LGTLVNRPLHSRSVMGGGIWVAIRVWAGLFVAAVCVLSVRWQFSRDLASATTTA